MMTSKLFTPYHALGGERGTRVPEWAQHRSVYRGPGRTTYLVETDELGAASADLTLLSRTGWDVQVERESHSSVARVLLSHADLPLAA